MCECRYYGRCAGNCDGHGLVLGFGNETYDCDDFQPMPDAEALVELAKEMVETFRLGHSPVRDSTQSGVGSCMTNMHASSARLWG